MRQHWALAISGLLAILLLPATAARADFAFVYNNHSYLFVQQKLSWTFAAREAAKLTVNGAVGHLVHIDDVAENQAIMDQLLTNVPANVFNSSRAGDGGNGAYVWIGASDLATEGQWLWDGDGDGLGVQFWQGNATGSAVGGRYQNWGRLGGTRNEPDNFLQNQDGGALSIDGWPLGNAGQWNDVAHTNGLYYLVEFAAVPEPGSFALLALGMIGCLALKVRERRRE